MAPESKPESIQLDSLTATSSHDAQDVLDRRDCGEKSDAALQPTPEAQPAAKEQPGSERKRGAEEPSSERTEIERPESKVVNAKDPDEDPFKGLSDDEAAILKRQVAAPQINAGIKTLYRYASTNDILIIIGSSFMSIVSGAAMPLMIVVFGSLQGKFQDFFAGNSDYGDFNRALSSTVVYFVYLAIGGFIATYTSTVGFICR